MKHFLSFALFAIFLAGAASLSKAAFVEGLEDIPIPEGLHQAENENLNFGNEEIRLIEVYLTAENTTFAKIISFYKETLPQMGWQIKKDNFDNAVFERDGESLDIAEEANNPLVIRLTVKSKMQ